MFRSENAFFSRRSFKEVHFSLRTCIFQKLGHLEEGLGKALLRLEQRLAPRLRLELRAVRLHARELVRQVRGLEVRRLAELLAFAKNKDADFFNGFFSNGYASAYFSNLIKNDLEHCDLSITLLEMAGVPLEVCKIQKERLLKFPRCFAKSVASCEC